MARILVVDDEHNLRLMVRLALVHSGHEVAVASDGGEALDRFGGGEAWDLVLLDHRMPGLTGLEVLQEIRRRAPGARVVVITAFGTIDLALDAMRAGAVGFLRKPFTTETLRATVASALTAAGRSTAGTERGSEFARTSLNGFHIEAIPAPTTAPSAEGVHRAFVVSVASGAPMPCDVHLSAAVAREAAGSHEALPGEPGTRFWTSLCEEALANHLWQHAEPPTGGVLHVWELTAGLRRWIDAIRGPSEQAASGGPA